MGTDVLLLTQLWNRYTCIVILSYACLKALVSKSVGRLSVSQSVEICVKYKFLKLS